MERLTGWHKLQNFDDEDVYYLQAEISIPLNGDAKRDIETTLREQIAREIEASSESYIHEDAIRLEDGTWPGLRVIAVEDVLNLIRGSK